MLLVDKWIIYLGLVFLFIFIGVREVWMYDRSYFEKLVIGSVIGLYCIGGGVINW